MGSVANAAAQAGDMGWVGKKPLRRLGGMADALAIATELGYSVQQEDAVQNAGKNDALVSALRELMVVQRALANLQVELQGRQDDESVSHLTHVSGIEKKCQALARTTTKLKDVIQNKDRIIARLQQPYSLDCIPVETEYQRQFAELLLKAAGDYGALTAAISDLQWTQSFKDPPSVWGDLLRPIPVALASCTRYYEALSAMRETVASYYKRKVQLGSLETPVKDADADCTTPIWNQATYVLDEPTSDDLLLRGRTRLKQINITANEKDWNASPDALQLDAFGDDVKQRRMSWPPSPTTPA
ncbi:hypothetical protein SELMODRAFT_115170 [Selaginella moellendorffii]|uniref:AUGMIN subunit 2 n=1 Tax=Selaginella moellendorffii TaxID=88036 RepID=D8SEH2_SELML|nr:AUGMIN subunit 2 [Selaginella moellendorffii]EFJ17288.1 hypothetical protein SELMODRAFT_115170 [Selaginella moellendorffii]|eukprot:XP_002981806.1 AUGMIN subunit 2 [Selaginella moellendorffii]